MTDEQFERLLSTLSRVQEDHDLLLKLNTKVDMSLTQARAAFDAHCQGNIENATELKRSAKAAHQRLDSIISWKDKLIGAAMLIMLIITIWTKLS